MKKLYIVTGAAGHLGNTIVSKLLSAQKEVRALIVEGDKMPIQHDLLMVTVGDVRKKETLYPLFVNSDDYQVIVIHCAGIVSIASKYNQAVYDVNVTGTKNVLDVCLEQQVTKVIYVSSVHAIKERPNGEVIREVADFNPNEVEGLYAKTKAEASAYALQPGS